MRILLMGASHTIKTIPNIGQGEKAIFMLLQFNKPEFANITVPAGGQEEVRQWRTHVLNNPTKLSIRNTLIGLAQIEDINREISQILDQVNAMRTTIKGDQELDNSIEELKKHVAEIEKAITSSRENNEDMLTKQLNYLKNSLPVVSSNISYSRKEPLLDSYNTQNKTQDNQTTNVKRLLEKTKYVLTFANKVKTSVLNRVTPEVANKVVQGSEYRRLK